MSAGLCCTSDVITLDQNWHHLYCKIREKDLSNDTQIVLIGSLEPEIGTKMLRNWSEKLGARFLPATLVKIFHLNNAVSEIHELEASPVEGQ